MWAKLDALPNELLTQITEEAGPQADLPRRLRVLWSLSLVNHRLRRFTLPLLFSQIHAPHAEQLSHLAKSLHQRDLLTFTSCIRVGKQLYPAFLTEPWYSPSGETLDMNVPLSTLYPGVRRFGYLDGPSSMDTLRSLALSPSLQSLTLACSGFCYPSAHAVPALETLRIQVLPGLLPHTHTAPPINWDALTTLVLHDTHYLLDTAWGVAHPNLRVLSLQKTTVDTRDIFDLIQRHPSLREVNVSLRPNPPPLIGALFRLIKGTGVWTDPDSALDDFHNQEIGQVDNLSGDEWAQPVLAIPLTGFAFVRAPAVPPHESDDPRRPPAHFNCTALALATLDDQDFDRSFDLSDILAAGDCAPCHTVEELSVVVRAPVVAYSSFSEYMAQSTAFLATGSHLRSLTLSWDIPHNWAWTHRDDPLWQAPKSILDAVCPPINSDTGSSMTLHDLHEDYRHLPGRAKPMLEWTESRNHVLTCMGLPAEVADKSVLLMPAWEKRNKAVVAQAVRLIGTRSATLEEFSWYIGRRESMRHGAVWRWKIVRSERGDVVDVQGELGSGWEEPAGFEMVVGQEKEQFHAARTAEGRGARHLVSSSAPVSAN